MPCISVLGTGGWGTALGVMLDRYGHQVTLFSVFPEEINELQDNRENRKLLPGVRIGETVSLTCNIEDLRGSDIFILAVPSYAMRDTARLLSRVYSGQIMINVSKGLENDSLKRLSQVIAEEIDGAEIVVLSGPSHAEEVSRELPTTLVAASEQHDLAEYVQETLMNPSFRIYTNRDLVGVELGGAVKNAIALAAGISDGLGYGDNTRAALITRGISEMARLGEAMGAQKSTFTGLSGIGDLVVTCNSMHSRNRRAGILIGKGVAPAEAVAQIGTVEGFHAVQNVHYLALRHGVETPIVDQCYNVCFGSTSPAEAVCTLMSRPGTHEAENLILNTY